MYQIFILMSLFCISLTAVAASQRDQQWLEDIDFLTEHAPEAHANFYKNLDKQQFLEAATALKQAVPKLADHQIKIGLASLLALAKDGHSFIRFYHPLVESEFGHGMAVKPIPLRFASFEDGIFVVATHRDFTQYLGAKLIAVNHTESGKALNIVSAMFPIENEMNIKQWGVYALSAPEVLHAFALSNTEKTASYTLQMGTTNQTVELAAIDRWPEELRGLVVDEQWQSLSDDGQPLYLQHLDQLVWYAYQPKHHLVYLKINSFAKAELAHIEQQVTAAIALSNEKVGSKLVIDIRHHPGGETGIVNGLVKAIAASHANQQKKLYVIIGGRTFSAAQLMATALEQYTYAIFVGEPTGIHIHFYANARNSFDLPHSGLKVFLSTKWWQTTNAADDRPWQEPDIYAPLTYSDYQQHKDPALEKILQYPQD
jgi:hypothetical protein